MVSQIKCPNCGIYNTNADYCTNCNTLLSYKIRRELQMAKEEKTRIEKRKIGDKNSVSLIEKMTSHRFLIVRIIGKTIHSIWLGFLAIGVFIAWLVTAVAG